MKGANFWIYMFVSGCTYGVVIVLVLGDVLHLPFPVYETACCIVGGVNGWYGRRSYAVLRWLITRLHALAETQNGGAA